VLVSGKLGPFLCTPPRCPPFTARNPLRYHDPHFFYDSPFLAVCAAWFVTRSPFTFFPPRSAPPLFSRKPLRRMGPSSFPASLPSGRRLTLNIDAHGPCGPSSFVCLALRKTFPLFSCFFFLYDCFHSVDSSLVNFPLTLIFPLGGLFLATRRRLSGRGRSVVRLARHYPGPVFHLLAFSMFL